MPNWGESKRHNFFTHTKKYPIYRQQEAEFLSILEENIGKDCKDIDSVLDVGCGNYRFKKLFECANYRGVDLEDGFDITKNWEDQNLTTKFDLVFTSLVLMGFEQKEMESIFKRMFDSSSKYIFIYEEINCLNEDKFDNNYDKLYPEKLVKKGVSSLNENWVWYLWKI